MRPTEGQVLLGPEKPHGASMAPGGFFAGGTQEDLKRRCGATDKERKTTGCRFSTAGQAHWAHLLIPLPVVTCLRFQGVHRSLGHAMPGIIHGTRRRLFRSLYTASHSCGLH